MEVDLSDDDATIQRLKLSHLDELWKLLPGNPEDYQLEPVVPGRFWRVHYSQPKRIKYPQIQGHWFPFDGVFHLNDTDALFLQQDRNLSGTTAGTVWDGALLLARYVPFMSSLLPYQATVLELGAGCGLAGMVVAIHSKANQLILTDLPDQLQRLHCNVDYNRTLLPKHTVVKSCDWFHPPEDMFPDTPGKQNARIIILADCVWMKELVKPLFAAVEKYLTNETIVLISYQTRGKDTNELFWEELRRIFSLIQTIHGQDNVCPIPPVFHLLCCSKPATFL